MKERGFTLVEMLVALSIFAAIASIGVGLLRASISTQDAVQDRLGAMGAINRLRAVMASDLAQAALRPTRESDGAVVEAFSGDASEMRLVHRGAGLAGDGMRSAVQRVGYRLVDSEWQRLSSNPADGAQPGASDAIAREVASVSLRYRDPAGTWRSRWSSQTEERLPTAVELTLTRRDRPALIMRFAVGPTLVPPPPPPGGAR